MKMNHKKKMIGPIVASCFLVLYFIVYFGAIVSVVDGVTKYLLGILPLVFVFIIIRVCVERIKEIKEGEEDDLSKY
jgi:hypothetical protein